MAQRAAAVADPPSFRFNKTAVPITIAAVLALTAASVVVMITWHRSANQDRFDHLEFKLRSSIARRVMDHRHGLQSVRGLVLAGEAAAVHSNASWRPATEARQIPLDPSQAFEFSELSKADQAAEEKKAAAAIDPEGPFNADGAVGKAFRDAVDSLNLGHGFPAAERVGKLGLPLATGAESIPVLFDADVAGQDVEGPKILKRSPVVDETLARATMLGHGVFANTSDGMFLVMPVYHGGATPPPSQRQGRSRGWVFMGLNGDVLFEGLSDEVDGELDVRLLSNRGETLFDSRTPALAATAEGAEEPLAPMERSSPLAVAGRTWQVETSRSQAFNARPTGDVWLAGLVGVILACLLAVLQHGQVRLAGRAEALARRMTSDLRVAALTDRLTGLANRPALLHRVQESIERAVEDPTWHHAVLFLDFDRFKIINDSLGHQSGDRLLRAIAERIQGQLRAEDVAAAANGRPGPRSTEGLAGTAARFGGDEFLIALEGLKEPGDAAAVAQRLLDTLAEPYDLGGREVVSTASIGVVVGDGAYRWAEEMIRDADTAMYEAKAAGRAAWVAFDKAMRDRVAARLQIETDLRGAAECGELELAFQPIMDLSRGASAASLHRWEALVRWNHPTRGRLSPDAFISVAEETGLIQPIGAWVLDTAIGQIARWRAEGVPGAENWKVGVNLARQQLRGTDLADLVRASLARHGVEGTSLHLEVTETEVMNDPESASAVLREVQALGVSVDMDDFGTGYSSLASLDHYPLDVIKIDRSFVADLEGDRRRVAMLSTVARLAHDLDMDIVAEGIETEEQLAEVTRLQCSHGQGYHFSKPLSAGEAVAWANQWAATHPRDPWLRFIEPPEPEDEERELGLGGSRLAA